MKVGIVAERRYLSQSMPAAVLRVLQARGISADVICPDDFPLVLKPTYGDNSQGLQVVRHPEDLKGIEWGDDLLLAQACWRRTVSYIGCCSAGLHTDSLSPCKGKRLHDYVR